jgi:hypothetical protein
MIEYSDFVRQYLTVAIFAGVGIGLGAGLLGINAQGAPSITWSTGPESGTRTSPEGPVSTEPAASKRAAAIGVAEDAIAVGSGPGSEALKGFQDNTEIFRIVHKEL